VCMVYDTEVRFSVGCKNHVPALSTATLEWVGKDGKAGTVGRGQKRPNHPKQVTEGLFRLVEDEFAGLRKTSTSLSSVSQASTCEAQR
jgi:hypothetical protein